MSFNIEIAADGTTAIARIAGEVDLANGADFSDELLGAMPDHASALVIDMTNLRYIDSAGVRSLFEIAATLTRRDQALAVAVPHDSVLRSVLKVTAVEEVAAICATEADAIAAVSRSSS